MNTQRMNYEEESCQLADYMDVDAVIEYEHTEDCEEETALELCEAFN